MGKTSKTTKGNKKILTKNKKQKLAQALAIFLAAATVLGTVAGYGITIFNGGDVSDTHAHYHDADGNTIHLEDIMSSADTSAVYYTDDGEEITFEEIIEENGIQFYEPEGNPVDFHNHTESDDSIMVDLSGTEEITENEEVDNIE